MFDPIKYYQQQTVITHPGMYRRYFDVLPSQLGQLIGLLPNMLLHYEDDAPYYHFAITRERQKEIDSRSIEVMLQRLLEQDTRPLTALREPSSRLFCTHRDFAVMLCAMLRHQNIPARVRYGFAHRFYQVSKPLIENILVEYWQAGRWYLAEARLSTLPMPFPQIVAQRVPRNWFYPAAKIWLKNSAQAIVPNKFFIKSSKPIRCYLRDILLLDLASLTGYEALTWDYWGRGNVQHHDDISEDNTEKLNQLSELDVGDPAELYTLHQQVKSDNTLYWQQVITSESPILGNYQVVPTTHTT